MEIINNQPVLKLKSNTETLDCEIKQTHRLFIRAFDCAPTEKRRYSERYEKMCFFFMKVLNSREVV